MNLIDFLLNLAALLLWIRWRSLSSIAAGSTAGAAWSQAPRAAGGFGRWLFLGALILLLGLRAVFYWHLGSAVSWVPRLELKVITLTFRSDYFDRMLLFSALSFGVWLAGFHFWLMLLSVANRRVPDSDPGQRWVRRQLGWLERWPAALKLLFPAFVGALAWVAAAPLLDRMGMIPATSPVHLWQQAGVVGLCAYLSWKAILVAVLLGHLLNSYVYLGPLPVWNFATTTARNLLRPFRWLPLRLGKIDLLPALGIVVVVMGASQAASRLARLYQQLPL